MNPEALAELLKSDVKKERLAIEERQKTTVPLKWLATQLHMGSPMNVSRLSRVRVHTDPRIFS